MCLLVDTTRSYRIYVMNFIFNITENQVAFWNFVSWTKKEILDVIEGVRDTNRVITQREKVVNKLNFLYSKYEQKL